MTTKLSNMAKSNLFIIQSASHSQSAGLWQSVMVHQPETVSHRDVASIRFASGRWFVMKVKVVRKHTWDIFATIFRLTHRWVLWLLFLFPIHNKDPIQNFQRYFSNPLHPIQHSHQISLEPVFTRPDWFILALWQQGSKHREHNVNDLPAANGPCCDETMKILTDFLHTSHCSYFRPTNFSLSPFISAQPWPGILNEHVTKRLGTCSLRNVFTY